MPSPGITTLKSDLAVSFTVEGGFTTNIALDGEFDTRMATGMHNGWTSATPTTMSTFQTQITAEFSTYTLGTGDGLHWLTCVSTELDAEVQLWVDSWDTDSESPTYLTHTYVPTASAIITRIETCELYTSNARTALDTAIADTFIAYFEQEVG